MKKIVSFSIIVTFILIACAKKVVPTTTSATTSSKTTATTKTNEVSKPVEMAQPVEHKEAKEEKSAVPQKVSDEETGKVVFNTKCSKCHAPKNVSSYTFTKWEGILKTMIPNAKLSGDEENQLVAYIKANSK